MQRPTTAKRTTKKRPTKKRITESPTSAGTGVVEADRMYTLTAFEEITGMGKRARRTARRNGLRVLYISKKAFVLGSDFISYVTKHAETQHPLGR